MPLIRGIKGLARAEPDVLAYMTVPKEHRAKLTPESMGPPPSYTTPRDTISLDRQ